MTMHSSTPTPMPTWRFTLGMIKAEPWRFVGNTLGYTLFCLCFFVPGWIAQQFFDLLSGQAPAGAAFASALDDELQRFATFLSLD